MGGDWKGTEGGVNVATVDSPVTFGPLAGVSLFIGGDIAVVGDAATNFITVTADRGDAWLGGSDSSGRLTNTPIGVTPENVAEITEYISDLVCTVSRRMASYPTTGYLTKESDGTSDTFNMVCVSVNDGVCAIETTADFVFSLNANLATWTVETDGLDDFLNLIVLNVYGSPVNMTIDGLTKPNPAEFEMVINFVDAEEIFVTFDLSTFHYIAAKAELFELTQLSTTTATQSPGGVVAMAKPTSHFSYSETDGTLWTTALVQCCVETVLSAFYCSCLCADKPEKKKFKHAKSKSNFSRVYQQH
eukprot:Selendium_serpulae@DN5897_c0_g1_i2.p1